MKYERLTAKEIARYMAIGNTIAREGKNLDVTIKEMIYNDEFEMWEIDSNAIEFVKIGYEGRSLPEEKTYYRIGEPKINHYIGTYCNSHNYADDKQEIGISVVTTEWLHSNKSVFFGAHNDDMLKARGVYKIRGIEIGKGGDGEPLIYAVDWAEKTRIRTYAGLEKAVKES